VAAPYAGDGRVHRRDLVGRQTEVGDVTVEDPLDVRLPGKLVKRLAFERLEITPPDPRGGLDVLEREPARLPSVS